MTLWFNNRRHHQPPIGAAETLEGTVAFLEAIAAESSVDDVFARLERLSVVLRIDDEVWPTVFRGATVSERELQQLRRIDAVVRLGRVEHIGTEQVRLTNGTIPTTPLTSMCTAQHQGCRADRRYLSSPPDGSRCRASPAPVFP